MSKSPKPRFYTTKKDAAASANEIGERVRKYGAKQFGVRFGDDGEPVALHFIVDVDGVGEVPVQLEAQVEALTDRLDTHRSRKSRKAHRRQAMKIAWRQLLAYVEMMLEMVENGMKPFHEAFMSDVVIWDGSEHRRLGEVYRDAGGKLLPPGRETIDADFEEVEP